MNNGARPSQWLRIRPRPAGRSRQAPAQGVFCLLGDRIAGTSKHGNKKWTKAARKQEQCIYWNKYAKCKNMVRPYAGLDAYSACKMNGEKYVENHHKIHETVEI